MIDYELLPADGILVLRPQGPLETADFVRITKQIDPYIAANGKLHGLLIDAEAFPGWESFAAMVAHFQFIHDHHRRIEKIAAVSDSFILSVAPKIASHFVQAEVRHFAHSKLAEAFAWLRA